MAHQDLKRLLVAGSAVAGALVPGAASAIDWNITGFVRQEIAVSITDERMDENIFNAPRKAQYIPGFGGLTPGGVRPVDNPANSSGYNSYVQNGLPLGFGGCGAAGVLCDENGNGINDEGASRRENVPFNLFNSRAELEIQAKFNEAVSAYARIRAYFDGTSAFTDAQIEKHFLTDAGFGGGRGNLLEIQSPDAMLDLPSLYFDVNFGSAWFRIGQQQIAWGEALFFRVFDVANGLDVRRHLFLDVAAEEYADERVASPGVRASYTFGNGWEVDAFVQMFSPSLFPNTNTPYNLIADGFTLQDQGPNGKVGKGFDDAENSLNFGARLIMPDMFIKDLTLSVMAVNRRNPDGVVKWDDANKINPGLLELGGRNRVAGFPDRANPFCNDTSLIGATTGSNGHIIGTCGHPFSLDGAGTMSYEDWWTLASRARLEPVQGAATSIAESPGSRQLAAPNGIGQMADGRWDFVSQAGSTIVTDPTTGADVLSPVNVAAVLACTANRTCTPISGRARKIRGMQVVSGFFTGFGPLRGHIRREYLRENILGASFNYIITSEPGSLLDQLIVRGEMSYTIDKKFTQISLSQLHDESDEILASIILEKYQSVFEAIPATYFVFEWMHRTDTDLAGRQLKGYSDGAELLTEDEDGSPNGVSSANYLTFAFQQPFPNLIWRADFAVLADVRGGLFFQPGVRYKPSSEWQFDVYANIAADVGGENDDMLETFDSMDEVFVRATFYF